MDAVGCSWIQLDAVGCSWVGTGRTWMHLGASTQASPMDGGAVHNMRISRDFPIAATTRRCALGTLLDLCLLSCFMMGLFVILRSQNYITSFLSPTEIDVRVTLLDKNAAFHSYAFFTLAASRFHQHATRPPAFSSPEFGPSSSSIFSIAIFRTLAIQIDRERRHLVHLPYHRRYVHTL